MIRRLIAWARAPEPRVPYAVARAEWQRERTEQQRRAREWRSAPVWLRWAPVVLYALPVFVFFGLIHGAWTGASLIAGSGTGLLSSVLETVWRRRLRGRRPSEPPPP